MGMLLAWVLLAPGYAPAPRLPRVALAVQRARPPTSLFDPSALHVPDLSVVLSSMSLPTFDSPAVLFGSTPEYISGISRKLSDSLSVGSQLRSASLGVNTGVVLESIGHDLLIFLTASVLVTPTCKVLKITPILGYLIAGCILGPHGLDVFSNSQADLELGDFGILFLLFSEGARPRHATRVPHAVTRRREPATRPPGTCGGFSFRLARPAAHALPPVSWPMCSMQSGPFGGGAQRCEGHEHWARGERTEISLAWRASS
eukprot:scaffold9828_cov105-Isochrysis_galbana.AAC.1